MEQSGIFPAIICFIVLFYFGCLVISLNRDSQFNHQVQIRLFSVAFIIRFALSILLYEYGLVHVIKDEDASLWIYSLPWRDMWIEEGVGLFGLPFKLIEWLSQETRQNYGYQYLLAVFFYLTGLSTRLPVAVLNGFAGALTVVFIYRIAALSFSSKIAERTGWIVCFFPSFLIWSAQTLKEPIVILLEILIIYGCFQMRKQGWSLKYLALCLLSIPLLYTLRFYASYVCAITLAFSLIIPPRISNRATLVLTVAFVLSISIVGTHILKRQNGMLGNFDTQRIQIIRQTVGSGRQGSGSGVVLGYDTSTLSGAVKQVVVGAVYLLLAPFPWQLGGASMRMLLTLPESLIWWGLFLGGTIPGTWYILRNRLAECLPFLLFLCGLMIPYSFMFANVGLAFRQRGQLLPYLIIISMVGFQQYWSRHKAGDTQDARSRVLNQRHSHLRPSW